MRFSTALLQPKPRAPPPPSLQQPPLQPPVSASLPKEMKDKDVQKFDLEELMIHMNFIIKTHDMYGKFLYCLCVVLNI